MKPIALHLTVFSLSEDVPMGDAEKIRRGLQEAVQFAQFPEIEAVDLLQLSAGELPSFLAQLESDVRAATHFALAKLGPRGQSLIDRELDHQFVWAPVELSGTGCVYFLYVLRVSEGVFIPDDECRCLIEGPPERPGFRWN